MGRLGIGRAGCDDTRAGPFDIFLATPPTRATPPRIRPRFAEPRAKPVGLESATEATHHYVLELDVLVEPVLRAFAAEARLLHAAERRDFGRDDAFVDADHPAFQRLRHAPRAAEIAGVEVRGQAERRVVCRRNRFFFRLETECRANGAEG